MFEAEHISISAGNPEVTNTFPLAKGECQTLLIPSNVQSEWMLVS